MNICFDTITATVETFCCVSESVPWLIATHTERQSRKIARHPRIQLLRWRRQWHQVRVNKSCLALEGQSSQPSHFRIMHVCHRLRQTVCLNKPAKSTNVFFGWSSLLVILSYNFLLFNGKTIGQSVCVVDRYEIFTVVILSALFVLCVMVHVSTQCVACVHHVLHGWILPCMCTCMRECMLAYVTTKIHNHPILLYNNNRLCGIDKTWKPRLGKWLTLRTEQCNVLIPNTMNKLCVIQSVNTDLFHSCHRIIRQAPWEIRKCYIWNGYKLVHPCYVDTWIVSLLSENYKFEHVFLLSMDLSWMCYLLCSCYFSWQYSCTQFVLLASSVLLFCGKQKCGAQFFRKMSMFCFI